MFTLIDLKLGEIATLLQHFFHTLFTISGYTIVIHHDLCTERSQEGYAMHAEISPQQDFFIYVPLIREQEGKAKVQRNPLLWEEQLVRDMEKNSHLSLSTWTRVPLPGRITIYTRPCGEEH